MVKEVGTPPEEERSGKGRTEWRICSIVKWENVIGMEWGVRSRLMRRGEIGVQVGEKRSRFREKSKWNLRRWGPEGLIEVFVLLDLWMDLDESV